MARAFAKVPVVLGRRQLMRSAAGAFVLGLGCTKPRAKGPPDFPYPARLTGRPGARRVPAEALRTLRDASARVALWSWFDLPFADPRSHELSGIAWDDATRTLHAVQDENGHVVSIVPDEELRAWTITGALKLDVGDPVDLEGIVLLPDGFYVCSEIGPHVFEVDRRGKLRRDVPLPAHFATARRNKSLESLTMSPSGAYLFTTSEAALGCDGLLATVTTGTRIRIARLDVKTGDVTEHVYATDPVDAQDEDYGVSELVALADDELLVLERGFAMGVGNSGRIYRTKLATAAACTRAEHVGDASAALPKQLFVDLGLLAVPGPPPPVRQPQPAPLLDNYECMSIGPVLPDGRASLIVASDDNARPKQVARILVLAVG
jgi:hypothetical protein